MKQDCMWIRVEGGPKRKRYAVVIEDRYGEIKSWSCRDEDSAKRFLAVLHLAVRDFTTDRVDIIDNPYAPKD
jgi:hypothetical protein